MAEFVKLEEISLKNSNEINEAWVQQTIADNPEILGLGDVFVRDKERKQLSGGRIDLLLESNDEDNPIRYEVEIQLGKTDESHIIRTIEYWDEEKNRYPSYDHVAVIVAEDITSRFLNVIHLFNRHIPIIAIQMKAVKIGENVSLIFTKVLNLAPLATDSDDRQVYSKVDRKVWEEKSTPQILKGCDKLVSFIQKKAPGYELNYVKPYVGLAKNGVSNNFMLFYPKKEWIRLKVYTDRTDALDSMISEASLEYRYNEKRGFYIITILPKDIDEIASLVEALTEVSYKN